LLSSGIMPVNRRVYLRDIRAAFLRIQTFNLYDRKKRRDDVVVIPDFLFVTAAHEIEELL
jgi:hypothetical protein